MWFKLLVDLALLAISFLATWWLAERTPKPKPDPWDVPLVPTGTPIPVLLGTQRVRPIPVCFIGDEPQEIVAGGSNATGRQVIGTNHYVTWQGLLCWGPIYSYENLVVNDTLLSTRMSPRRELNPDSYLVTGVPTYVTKPAIQITSGTWRGVYDFTLYMPDIFRQFDGIGGDFTLYFGTGQSGPDPILEAAKGVGNVPWYRELAYIVFDQFRTGMDPSRPLDLVLSKDIGEPDFGGFLNPRVIDGDSVSVALGFTSWNHRDVSVPAALYALYKDRRWALGVDISEVDRDQFIGVQLQTNGGQYASETTGVSALITSPTQASEIRDEWLQILNAVLVRHPETNKIQIKLIRNETPDQAAIDALRSFDEDDITSCKVTQRSWAETVNEVVVEFSNPALLYGTDSRRAMNDASIATTGGIRSMKLSLPSVTDPLLAQRIALRELRAGSTVLEKQTLVMTRAAWDLERGDVFKVTYPKVGYEDRVLRVLSVSLGTPWAGRVTVEAIDDVFAHEEPPMTIAPREPGPPQTVPPRMPIFQTITTYDATTGYLTLIVIDPDERLVAGSVEFATQVGEGSPSAYVADATEPYQATVPRDATEITHILWRADYTDANGDTATAEGIVDFPANTTLVSPNPVFVDHVSGPTPVYAKSTGAQIFVKH